MKTSKIFLVSLIIITLLFILSFSSCNNATKAVSQDNKETSEGTEEMTETAKEEDGGIPEEEIEAEEAQEAEAIADSEEGMETEEAEYSGLCINPYFPVIPDTIWNYYVQSPSENYEYFSHFIDITDTSFTEKMESEVFNADIKWLCTAEGMVQSEYSALIIEDDAQGVEFNTESYKGVTLPPPEKWSIGFEWDTEYVVSTRIVEEGEEMLFTGDIIIKNEIVDIESVTVPAGTFPEAFKVVSIKDMNISADIAGNSMSFNAHTDISTWYSENTGMIKQVSKAICGTTTVELLSVEEEEG